MHQIEKVNQENNKKMFRRGFVGRVHEYPVNQGLWPVLWDCIPWCSTQRSHMEIFTEAHRADEVEQPEFFKEVFKECFFGSSFF